MRERASARTGDGALRAVWIAALAVGVVGGPAPAGAAGEVKPGAYCALPKKGETPKCLEPAMAEYGEFFTALADDEVDDEALARVEQAVAAGPESEKAYLALSSLAYGYYRLSERAVQTPGADPEIAARLQRWNAILGQAYESNPQESYRQAIRDAAQDIKSQTPPGEMRCVNPRGETVACDSGEAVMLGIDATAGEVGIRGGLERLLERMLGPDDS